MCIYLSCCYTAEVDQFTSRLQFQGLKDSSEIINTKANEFLKKSIDEANKESSNCDEDILYRKMRNYFANHQKGDLTIFAIHDASVDRIKIRIDESIYKNWSFSSGALISKNAKKLSDMTLSPLIKIGSQVIGTDKLEHLFGRGFAYFTDYYKEKKSLNDTLYTGTYQERWIYGGNPLASGVS